MLQITKTQNADGLVFALEGRLDTTTSPQLEAEVKALSPKVKNLEFDLAKLKYISSAGLRVILAAQKTMNKQGKMVIKNVNDTVNEVFEITGFANILTIE
ncbi:MAG TPA: STAS domain-containing protein [Methanocorpusculum sp.]|nr:STAS domain-containing protein [Methanocorpusculum sp.]